MSLRLRAVLIAGVALALLWTLAAAWMLHDVHSRVDRTLDQRLAMSARMVSGLMQRATLMPAGPDALLEPITVGGGQGIACQVRTQRGEIVAATSGAPLAALDVPAPGFADRHVDGEVWRTYTLRFGDHYITTADRIDERGTLARGILLAAGVPFVVALLGGLLALWIGISRGLAPLDALRRTLQARDAESTEPVDGAGAPAELRPLIDALNGLLERLAAALGQQRAFTDAAAHELRTPLTVVDTHLQVARMAAGPDAESLRSAGEGVRRLRHTLDQLMVLTRAEAAGGAGDACDSVLGAVGDVIARIPEPDRERIALEVSGADAASPIPHSMLVTALRNVLDNALRYGGQGPVELAVRFDRAGRRVAIEVADRGPGMSEAELANAGQRFWRGASSRDGGDGAGLGLSIVSAIAGRYDGTVELNAREGGGLRVRLELPAG
ncbi:ATP-binding protein [Luteimonas sp. JM171]|uniref:ATP-binding protein n=1 Tax=Luteimonas sp. JM171 TaxID=1896164 RepID=UPI000856698D|nr:ATP-binding protein [Luteimonas sp. JM171]AOH35838.1 two-component sensor histidine kinase [Luteimonas sp. JM171]